MTKFRLSSKLYGGIAVLAAMSGLLAWNSVRATENLYTQIVTLQDDVYKPTVSIMNAGQELLVWNRALLRHLNESDLQAQKKQEEVLKTSSQTVLSSIGEIAGWKDASDNEKHVAAAIHERFQKLLPIQEKIVASSHSDKRDEARALLGTIRGDVDFMDSSIDELVQEEHKQFDEATRISKEVYNTMEQRLQIVIGLLVLTVIGLVFTIRAPIITIQRIIQQLSQSSQQVGSASMQIATSSQTLAGAAANQASSTEETSASLEEIGGMVEANLKSAELSSGLAETVRKNTAEGDSSITSLATSMVAVLESNKRIETLVKVIEEIGEKTAIIDEIVFQTKLLSFNASVEAERAGEHGRGFAVVAQEVGNLAQMSGKAALEIAGIVKSSIKDAQAIASENRERVEKGHDLTGVASQILRQTVGNADQLLTSSKQILNASKEQSAGIRQINSAMDAINRGTQATAATSEEAASASEELSTQATMLASLVQELSGIINGSEHLAGSSESSFARAKPNLRPLANVIQHPALKRAHADDGGTAAPLRQAAGSDISAGADDAWTKL